MAINMASSFSKSLEIDSSGHCVTGRWLWNEIGGWRLDVLGHLRRQVYIHAYGMEE